MKKIAPCVLIKVITTKPEQNTKEQPYWTYVDKVDSKKSNRHKQRLLLVREKSVVVRMRP